MRASEQGIVKDWLSKLERVAGFECSLHEDWTGNPITRLKVVVDPEPSPEGAAFLERGVAAVDRFLDEVVAVAEETPS